MKPLISYVSGTFNRLPLLKGLIDSIRLDVPPGMPYEIILVDGGSTDGTLDYIRQQPDVTAIEHGELRGAITAFTEGAYAARGRYVVLLNDDVALHRGTTVKALVHLEDNPRAGAVAFADNRPVMGKREGAYQVLVMPGRSPDGSSVYIPYAQCGMFRKWLGDQVGWWTGNEEAFAKVARTYGGDNMLSAKIWQHGYTVDAVDGCRVDDFVHDDDLRRINTGSETGVKDGEAYYSVFPDGVPVGSLEMPPQQDGRRTRVLYLPIYEPGWDIQKGGKRGLRDALAKAGIVYEYDYLAADPRRLQGELLRLVQLFLPDILLTQIHAPEPLGADVLAYIRAAFPRLVMVNWNGDYWPDGLTSARMLDLLRFVDLQLTVNASPAVLKAYEQAGIPAAYWQIGYEEPGDDLPDMPAHDVVFLGNCYSDARRELEHVLAGYDAAFYGSGWVESAGNTTYDFAAGKALYQRAKIAIGDNQFEDAVGFVSNRLFQALAAGGCLLLHQRVRALDELTGIRAGVHYIAWDTHEELRAYIDHYLAHEDERRVIAEAGTAYVREQHSFEARVRQLFAELLPLCRRQPAKSKLLVYTGRLKKGGAMGRLTRRHYSYTRGAPVLVDALDVPYLLDSGHWTEYDGS